MSPKLIKTLSIASIIVILLFVLTGSVVSTFNQEADLRSQFVQKTSERTASFDAMWKTLDQKTQVALKNDASFSKNVETIMKSREDSPNLMMKWVTESNPNANFAEVSVLYQDLSRAIEAKREGFFIQEKYLQDIKRQHDNLRTKFPSSIILSLFGKGELDYKPITSSRTEKVIATGKDDSVSLIK